MVKNECFISVVLFCRLFCSLIMIVEYDIQVNSSFILIAFGYLQFNARLCFFIFTNPFFYQSSCKSWALDGAHVFAGIS